MILLALNVIAAFLGTPFAAAACALPVAMLRGGTPLEALYPYLAKKKPQTLVSGIILAAAGHYMEPATGIPMLSLFVGPIIATRKKRDKKTSVLALHLAAAAIPHLIASAMQKRIDACVALLMLIASDIPAAVADIDEAESKYF